MVKLNRRKDLITGRVYDIELDKACYPNLLLVNKKLSMPYTFKSEEKGKILFTPEELNRASITDISGPQFTSDIK